MQRILLVDDDLELLKQIQRYLSFENYEIETASSGLKALELLSERKYDVVVLDWSIDQLTGPEICQRFRSGGGTTPVIFLTGHDAIGDKVVAYDIGADDYLTKPFHMKELLLRVKAISSRSEKTETHILQYGDIEYHVHSSRAYKNSEHVALTKLEKLVLEFLLKNQGEAFSSEVLIRYLWPIDAERSDEAVRNIVRRLRKKIDPESSIIKNIHGFGYSIGSN